MSWILVLNSALDVLQCAETVSKVVEALDRGSAGQADPDRTARLSTSQISYPSCCNNCCISQLTLLDLFVTLQVEDARATLELYKHEQYAWEKYLRTSKSNSSLVGVAPALPEKETDDDAPKALSAAAKAHLDSDDEDKSTGRGIMAVPDTKELAIMEYGE